MSHIRRLTPVLLVAAGMVILAAGLWTWDLLRGSDDQTFVVVNDDNTVTITNRDNLPFRLSFPLPRDCAEVKVELDRVVADPTATPQAASGQVALKVGLLSLLGEELCSYREWADVQATTLTEFTARDTAPTSSGDSDAPAAP